MAGLPKELTMTTFPTAKHAPRNLSRLLTAGLLVLGLAAGSGLEGTAFAGQPADGAGVQKGQGAHDKRGHHGPRSPAALIKRFDSNGDGKLAIAELPKKKQARLGAADSDKDGFFSVEELRARAAQRGKEHFAKRDANGDGALTAAEVGERGWARLKVADKNGDARVTSAELFEARASGTLKGARHGHKEARPGAPAR
jgi:EF hand domain-containing protein